MAPHLAPSSLPLPSHVKTSPKTLLHLPDELLLSIFESLKVEALHIRWHLEGRDAKRLRATCKRLNRIASPYLYQTLYLSCHQLDLDVFHLVAKNPLLIGGVRELVIDDTTFPTCISDWDTYKRAVALWGYIRQDPELDDDDDDDPTLEGLCRGFNRMTISKSMWELYNRTARAHHENRLTHADIAALKEALSRMKSLCSLVVTNRTAFGDRWSNSPLARLWRSIPQTGFITPLRGAIPLAPRCDWVPHLGNEAGSDVYSLDSLDDRLFTTVPPGEPDGGYDEFKDDDLVYAREHYYTYQSTMGAANNVGRDPEILSREARALRVALQVLEDPNAGPQLREFRVEASTDSIESSPGLPITLFGHLSPFPDRLSRAFSTTNMTKLRLVLSNFEDRRKGRKTMDQGRVTQLLASMPQLEQLYFEPHGMATVGALPEIKFPRLHRAYFSCGEVNPDKLVRFLERQGSTLKWLDIAACNIIPEAGQVWQDVADKINCLQRQQLINLDEASIWQCSVRKTQEGCVILGWTPCGWDRPSGSWYLEDGFLKRGRHTRPSHGD